MKKVRIGFVGCGCISPIYLKNFTKMFKEVEIIGVCDLIRERAEKAVAEYNIPKLYADMYELFRDPEVDIVLNITRPYEHYEVTKQALLHGKHVYSEKPLSPDLKEARELVALAQEKGLMLGGAPDTFMGTGIQTCRHLIDSGFIGTPIGGSASFVSRGPEDWHPDPEFVYQYGGGPMFDMGPYYVTALINLLGGVDSVCGMTQISYPTRPILSSKKYGTVMKVDVPTYVMGTLRFHSGAIANVFTTFDVSNLQDGTRLEIYGSEGSIVVPDPNQFDGEILLKRGRSKEIISMPRIFSYSENSRGLGLADMAKALQTGRPFRANSQQQLHVVEVMSAFYSSSERNAFVKIESPYERQAPMKTTELIGILED
ncbi:MAG: Gfo/Idh/MocA family oxidoreductase [Clostridia bacterium]|nr:Gfo/Idh/MocA family oxidoreductase [Clostridia bacterium]